MVKSPGLGLCNYSYSANLWSVCLLDHCAYTQRLRTPLLTTNRHRSIQGRVHLPQSSVFIGRGRFVQSAGKEFQLCVAVQLSPSYF